jgi:hypothetical protein
MSCPCGAEEGKGVKVQVEDAFHGRYESQESDESGGRDDSEKFRLRIVRGACRRDAYTTKCKSSG